MLCATEVTLVHHARPACPGLFDVPPSCFFSVPLTYEGQLKKTKSPNNQASREKSRGRIAASSCCCGPPASGMMGGGGFIGPGSSAEASGPPSASAALVLAQYRTHLLELYSHFCGASSSLPLAGFCAFAESFDLSPGYLSADKVEEAFDESARGRNSSPAAAGALSFNEFQDALCLLAAAVADKQWKIEYSAEKSARYRYKLKDAEKSRVEPGPEERLEGLLVALELNDARKYRKRAGMPPPPQASPSSHPPGKRFRESPLGATSRQAGAERRRPRGAICPPSPAGATTTCTALICRRKRRRRRRRRWLRHERIDPGARRRRRRRREQRARDRAARRGAGRNRAAQAAAGRSARRRPGVAARAAGYGAASSAAAASGGSSPRPGAPTAGRRAARRGATDTASRMTRAPPPRRAHGHHAVTADDAARAGRRPQPAPPAASPAHSPQTGSSAALPTAEAAADRPGSPRATSSSRRGLPRPMAVAAARRRRAWRRRAA